MRRVPSALPSLFGMGVALGLGVLAPACHMDPRSEEIAAAVPEAEQVTIGDVRWYVDYEAALALARAQDKALWVHFGENPG